MRSLTSEFDVAAPAEQVRRVLLAVDEYDRWHPDVHRSMRRASWHLPLAMRARLRARIVPFEERPGVLGVWLLVAGVPLVEHRFELRAAGRSHTVVRHTQRVRRVLAPIASRREVAAGHDRTDYRLRSRGEWLEYAPDTSLQPVSLAPSLAPTAISS